MLFRLHFLLYCICCLYNQFYFLRYISFYVACAFVICLIKYLLTHLLTYLLTYLLSIWRNAIASIFYFKKTSLHIDYKRSCHRMTFVYL